jgi:urocanate hydratase
VLTQLIRLYVKANRFSDCDHVLRRRILVADGTENSRRRIERVLTSDPGMGVLRHADAGYSRAIEFAREHDLDRPTEPKARD